MALNKSMNIEEIIIFYGINQYWDKGFTGKGMRVAIIDTGIDVDSFPLEKIVYKQNFTQDNGVKNVRDYKKHGTLVTSIISSIAPNSELVILKAISKKEASLSSFVACIRKALELNVDVINISMSCAKNYIVLENLVQERCKDEIILVATGNEYNKKILFPSSYKNVISIGSCSKEKNKSTFSNNSKDDIYVLGENINIQNGENTYTKNGTSFSCAIASGITILILQELKTKGIQDKEVIKKEVLKKLKEIGNTKNLG